MRPRSAVIVPTRRIQASVSIQQHIRSRKASMKESVACMIGEDERICSVKMGARLLAEWALGLAWPQYIVLCMLVPERHQHQRVRYDTS